jgi:hypothetical protein
VGALTFPRAALALRGVRPPGRFTGP